jgi:hypothetical protein
MLLTRDGQYVSAISVVKGSKENKVDLGNGHKMFYDNVLMELNVATSYGEEELLENLRDCFTRASRAVRGFIMKPQASQTYPASECRHKDALVFGCEPEYDVYELTQLNPPTCEPGNTFRSAGGHIHLGYDSEAYPLLAPKTEDDRSERDFGRIWVVRMMDLFVGLPALLVDHDPTSATRRKLYGRAGSHRPKEDYGVEYRATSNFWLQSPRLARLVYRLSKFTVDFVAERKHEELWPDLDTCKGYDVQKLLKTINDSNIRVAREMMEKVVKRYMPNDLYTEVFQLAEPAEYNFYREWGLA